MRIESKRSLANFIGHFDKEATNDFQNYLGEIVKLMVLIMDQHSFTYKEFLPMRIGHFDKEVMRDLENYLGETEKQMAFMID